MTQILLIPDVHCRPNTDLSYLANIGHLAVEKKVPTIIQIGDWADMPSLSSYDVGKRSHEGMRYIEDCRAAIEGMQCLLEPIEEYNRKARKNKTAQYRPRLVLTLGNHENRISRATENSAMLTGAIGLDDLKYEEFGWEVYPFLEVVNVHDIMFSHYFTSGVMGRPCASARLMLQKKHMSCVAGHVQSHEIANMFKADGKEIVGLFCGTAYEGHHTYLGAQGQNHYRGVWILKNVKDGTFSPVPYTLEELKARYE